MKQGGKRVGAGRKLGTANKKTREIANKAAAEGITPLEVMLDNMRFAHCEAGTILAQILKAGPEADLDMLKTLMRFRSMAQECAKDAAPYIHARLANISIGNEDDKPFEHKITVTYIDAKKSD